MKENMRSVTRDRTLGSESAGRYLTRALPMGQQKLLGYPLQTLAAVLGAFQDKDPDLAELHAYMGVAAIEQYCLDQNWDTA